MVGHLAIDDERSESRPGVLICHEGPGLDEHAKVGPSASPAWVMPLSPSTTTARGSRSNGMR